MIEEVRSIADEILKEDIINFFIQGLPEIFYLLDKEGVILFISRAVEILGYSADELIGENIKKVIHPEDLMLLSAPLPDDTGDEGANHAHSFEIRFLGKQRNEIYGLVTSFGEIEGARGLFGNFGLIRNITNYKTLEEEWHFAMYQAEAGVRAKSTFLSNISHSIRTPISAIIGISRLLLQYQSDNLTGEQKTGLQAIKESGSKALTLIDDVLILSKKDIEKDAESVPEEGHI